MALEVGDIMLRLEGQQERLTRLQSESLSRQSAKRSEEVARFRRDHEERPARVLADIERQSEREYEEALLRLREEEVAKHSVTLAKFLDKI
jgi:hypothetical protein